MSRSYQRSESRRRQASRLLRVLTLAVVSFAPACTWATQIAVDHFSIGASPASGDYTVGSLLGQNPTIPGFSGGWYSSNGSSMNIQSASLSYSSANYPASTGGSLFSPSSNNRVHRLFDATVNPFQTTSDGPVYLSYLYQNSFSSTSNYIAFEMHNGGDSDSSRTFQLGVSQTDFLSATAFGFRVNNQGALSSPLGPRNTTVNLFVIKFELSTAVGGDSITVWHNPALSSLTSDPPGGIVRSGFDFAADRLGVGRFTSDSNFDFALDELRIGTSLGDVLSDTFLACDISGNGVCNSSDLLTISTNLFTAGGYAQGDLNGDGMIDFADFRQFKSDPNRVTGFDPLAADVTVPEPVGLVLWGLVGLGAVGFLRRGQRGPRAG